MQKFFKNTRVFTVLFFATLILDIVAKLNFPVALRFVTKPLVIVMLIAYYVLNARKRSFTKYKIMLAALSMYLIGDVFLISDGMLLFGVGMLFFILGKVFYILRFSNGHDFSIIKIIPFLFICFLYIVVIMPLVYDNLGVFLLPILLYVFVALLVFLFAYLRKNAVDKKSYLWVLIGVVSSILADTVGLFEKFYEGYMPFNAVSIMLFYGISQYFIVVGVANERYKRNNYDNSVVV